MNHLGLEPMTVHRRQMVPVCVCVCVPGLPDVSIVLLGGVQVLRGDQARLLAVLLLLGHAPGPEHTNTRV